MNSAAAAGSRASERSDVSARRGRATVAVFAVVAAVALVAVPLIGSAYVLQFATDVLTFVTLACAWNLISGFTGYVSFGQVSFFGIGAYATALLVLRTGVPWYLAVIAAAAVGGVAGLALGAIMLKLRGILFALGMFGLARILTVIASNWTFAGGAVGLTLPAQLTPVAVYAGMAAAAVCAFGVNVFFSRSGFGLDAMSVRDDEDAAAALGVPTTRVKVVAFVLSAIFPAVAGGLVAWSRSFMDPVSAFDPGIDLRVVVFTLFGGIGTLWGPLLGSLVLMIVAEQLWAHLPELELALFGALIIAVVLALPGGLVGLANRFGLLRRRLILAPPAFPDVEAPRTPTVPERTEPALDVQDVTVRFGGVLALQRVSFCVRSGETVSIIGANGAGKTTLFNVITGFVTPSEGAVAYYGERISGLPPFELARRGIGRTFQIPRLMESMSVWENVVLASRHGRQWRNPVRHAAWALATVRLESLWLEPAQNLTPGQRRRLEFARVLALQPTIVLLDEVMAGMTRDEQDEIRDVIRRLKDLGVAAVAGVEHVVSAIRDLSDRMIVLDFGKKIAEGVPEAVLRDPVVVRAYLGEPPNDRAGLREEDRGGDARGDAPRPGRGARLAGETAVTSPPARLGGEPALVVEELVSGVGPLTILHGVSLEVGAGEVTVVLGANGAGKTTLLRTIAGILAPRAGRIRLFGESITDRPAHLVTRAGIGHVPSGRELFPRLPVADHLELGGRLCEPARRAELRERSLDLLPALRPLLRQNAGSLSGGEQQMLAIARALMTDPRVLLLDEPSTGLAPKVVLSVFETLPRLLEQGMSVLLVEQSLSLALSAARRAYVIDDGRIVLSGTAAELAADPRVLKAYLGT